MVWGMSLHAFTVLHAVIALIGIASGLIVLFGMIANKPLNALHGVFLAATVLTSVTAFGFRFHGFNPPINLAIISLVVLAATILARYLFHMEGSWRSVYVIGSALALYLNVFVLVVQSFMKVPALKALAPTQKEPPFLVAQLAVSLAFIWLTILAAKRFRIGTARAAASGTSLS